ncbi:MAG: cysteine--tRNA ligase [Bacillaceae bacterium]|nr:cysteine--tRNA ligase [Bacillaceae bacterium]
MSIQLYNTLTRKKEKLEPLEPGKIRMYVCGPTVYNHIHIGNARAFLVFDVIRRYLEYRGYDVTYVQNFTDVDDKLIRTAEDMGKTVPEVADQFIASYQEDTEALGVKKADVHPRVTEHIDEIISFIKQLVDKGVAYEVDGDVYFDTEKFPEYGKLSHQNIDELKAGARIDVNEKKKNPLDFALWKKAKPGEIAWDSPWGKGRPGWHIECSAMSMKYLGESFDIHAGGTDLCFPHHENEIAQSESLTEKPMARYWLHNGFLNINNEKMSKSLGNFLTAKDLIQQYSPQLIRFFMLTAHYRHPINFSEELLEQAEKGRERITNVIENLEHRKQASLDGELDVDEQKKIEKAREKFIAEMDDDFNTPNAITVIFELVKDANHYLRRPQVNRQTIQAYLDMIHELTGVLGLEFNENKDEALLDEEIEKLIEERTEARIQKNYARADEIRDLLKSKGIVLEDTPQGVRWRRET